MSETIRLHIQFTGRVQGVGFRYKAQHLATSLNITGWVYNELDGTVSMEAQGSPKAIDTLINRLDSDTWIALESIHKQNLPIDTYERSFSIRY
ncbi:MAG: acylphosphatase [Treponema sp.]|nr:acylphosphatase [Treponema sp.]